MDERWWRVGIPLVALGCMLLLIRIGSSGILDGQAMIPASTGSAFPASEVPPSRVLGAGAPTRGLLPTVSSGRSSCPATARIAAYGFPRGFHFFPPHHPLHPDPSIEPDRCYRTASDAAVDGFTLGLPPQGWSETGGLLLAPDWAIGIDPDRWCQDAANALGFPVPCLHSFPAPGGVSGLPRCGTGFPVNPGCIVGGPGAWFSLQYQGFPDIDGLPVGGWGLAVAAVDEDRAGPGSSFEALVLCGGTPRVNEVQVNFPWTQEHTTYRAVLIECRGATPPSDGQLILRWEREGVVSALAVPMRISDARDVLLTLSESITFVEPEAGVRVLLSPPQAATG